MSSPPLFLIEQSPDQSVRRRRLRWRIMWVTVAFTWLTISVWWGVIRPIQIEMRTSLQLSNLVLLYRDYETVYRQPPESLQEFEAFLASELSAASRLKYGEIPLALELIRSDKFVVLWETGPGSLIWNSSYVFGYDVDVPVAGGRVLLANGRLQKMTVAQFAWTPKLPTAQPVLGY